MNRKPNSSPPFRTDYTALEKNIGYTFRDSALLETALTHSSYTNENSGRYPCYERLEFLGDSILGFVTAEFLFHHEPRIPEGRMTRLRSELVCEQSLHRVAQELSISDYMRLGRGEEHSGGRQRKSVLADMVEAIIAAHTYANRRGLPVRGTDGDVYRIVSAGGGALIETDTDGPWEVKRSIHPA